VRVAGAGSTVVVSLAGLVRLDWMAARRVPTTLGKTQDREPHKLTSSSSVSVARATSRLLRSCRACCRSCRRHTAALLARAAAAAGARLDAVKGALARDWATALQTAIVVGRSAPTSCAAQQGGVPTHTPQVRWDEGPSGDPVYRWLARQVQISHHRPLQASCLRGKRHSTA